MRVVANFYLGLINGLAIIAGIMLAVIFVGIVADVAIRTVGFNSLQWYSAIAEYCLLFSTMLGAPWLVRLKAHVVVESLTLAMPPLIRMVMAKTVYLVCIFFVLGLYSSKRRFECQVGLQLHLFDLLLLIA